ncbi:3-oxoacyl-[acyl-carrier-protein] synthase III C-terminal domain-containing protein [Roseisalinus antarcticus]|uniref:3-oxoacyl-[acyl-carrier-protein] synthase 3 n=1 Tax=Roseisalinus antarcticus TaxID=254357 RepID=A0A1Y5SEA3_9RHOB|nr:3-oxoacyl-[acyl-carrier-protein] synthase III C-terminal domain-containing protein [Roseisalinus antarcticus]SLN37654.1 3-oxoacyl-[acyl-carrier-protein] synthase 3 [Roseisalinus antarcticus]
MIRIAGSGYHLPSHVLTRDEIAQRYGEASARKADRSGVLSRRYAEGESQIAMGVAAGQAALSDAGLECAQVDMVISAAAVPYQPIPGSAAIYAHALGLADGAVETMDVNTTCLSFLSAFDLAATYIAAGHVARVLIVSSEVASRGLPWADDPETAALFGDGAAAVVLTAGDTRIAARAFETHGSAWTACQLAAGGTRIDYRDPEAEFAAHTVFRMDGKALFKLSAASLPGFVSSLIARAGWTPDEVSRVIPHQASPLGLRHAARACGFCAGTFVDICAEFGNMIAASIPFVLARECAAGRVRPGDRLLMLGTSAGVSFGGVALEIAA